MRLSDSVIPFFSIMNVAYHEALPDSYLLILAPGRENETAPETALAHWLRHARHCDKPAVWVDCGMLHSLSGEAAGLLRAAHWQLLAAQRQLVLVHVPERVKHALLQRGPELAPCILPTLLDAARQAAARPVLAGAA